MILSASTSLVAMDTPSAGEAFSTRNPSQQFIDNYGVKAHNKFQQMTPQIIEKVTQFLWDETRQSSAPAIKDFIN